MSLRADGQGSRGRGRVQEGRASPTPARLGEARAVAGGVSVSCSRQVRLSYVATAFCLVAHNSGGDVDSRKLSCLEGDVSIFRRENQVGSLALNAPSFEELPLP